MAKEDSLVVFSLAIQGHKSHFCNDAYPKASMAVKINTAIATYYTWWATLHNSVGAYIEYIGHY